MVFAGFFISSARYVSVTVEAVAPPDAVFVTGNFDVSGATLMYRDQLVVTPTDIEFKTDGTKLFVSLQGSSSIYEYAISNAWDLTTISADATTSLSVSNMSQVQTIDFNRSGTKLYACGSGNVAEFSLSSAYDLSTAGSQSTLDINVYSGTTIYGACFSNSESNNYLHFTSSNANHVNTISTIELKDPISGSTFLGRSANVVPMLSNVVAPDLHTTRTLEVSGGGSRMYQIYRNTDLSNVYIAEFKLGTPHDASTLTSATQIEDYFDLAEQTGGTALYDTFNSLKIKPDGSEMFLSGTYFYDATGNRTSLVANQSASGSLFYSRNLNYILVSYGQYTYGNIKIYEYDDATDTFTQIHNIYGTSTNIYTYGPKCMAGVGTRFFNSYISGRYLTINDYNGSSWSVTQKITLSSPYSFTGSKITLSENEDMFFVSLSGYTSPVGRVGVYTESGGTWSQTQLIVNPYTSSDSDINSIAVSKDNTTLVAGDPFSNYNSTDNGVVWLFSNVAGTWTHTGAFDNPYSGSNLQFGSSLAINEHGTRVFIGSYYYNSQQGTLHVFDYDGSSWSLSQTIDGTGGTGAGFGVSVSCSNDGNRFIVGAWTESTNGRAYIYDYVGTTWSLSQTLTHVYGSRRFGRYVGISPDNSRLVVSETFTTGIGYVHYYTSPKNTQTYSLDIPTPVLYISGEQSNVYDIWNGTANVSATGTGDFITVDTISKVGSNCLTFDNSTTSVVVPIFSGANTLPLSISFWYNKTNTNTEDVLFTTSSFNSASGTTAGFSIHAQSTAGEYIEIECNSADYTRSSIQCSNYTWNHVVITISSAGSVEIYINGTRDTSTTASGWDLTSSNFATGQNIILGDDPTSASHFGGYMDEIKVFNAVLTEQTVKKIYLDGLAPAKTQAFHLTFEDNTGADILPSGASLGGTSLATLQSNVITYQGDYVGDFTGANSNVQVTNWSTFDTPFTFSFWLYLTAPSGRNSTDFVHSSNIYESGKVGFMYQLASASDPYEIGVLVRTNTSLALDTAPTLYSLDNRWSHHVGTYDGSSFNIYLDGVNILSFSVSADITTGQDLLFMKGYPFSPTDIRKPYGYLDDLRVYDYILSPVEVEYLYTSTLVHTNQLFYLSYDQSNVYEHHNYNENVTATGTGVYYQNPGSKIGTHSGEYPQSTTGTVVPTLAGLTFGTELTFSLWVFPTDLPGTSTLFATDNFSTATYGLATLLHNFSGILYIRVYVRRADSKNRYVSTSLGSINNFINKWTHFVFVYTSSTGYIYVNSSKQTTTNSPDVYIFEGITAGYDLRIGNIEGSTTSDFDGAIDDFRVFKRALTDREIGGLYRQYTQSRLYTLNIPLGTLDSVPPVVLSDYIVDTVNTFNFSTTGITISRDGLRSSGYNNPTGDLTVVRVGIQTLSTAYTVSTTGSVSWSSNYDRANRPRCVAMVRNPSHSDYGKKFWVSGDLHETSLFTATNAWDLSAGSWSTVINSVSGQPRVRFFDFTPDGMTFYAYNDTDQDLRIYNLTTAYDISSVNVDSPDSTIASFRTNLGFSSSGIISSIEWVNDGKYCYVMNNQGEVRLVNTSSNPYDPTLLIERNVISADPTTFNESSTETGFFIVPDNVTTGSNGVFISGVKGYSFMIPSLIGPTPILRATFNESSFPSGDDIDPTSGTSGLTYTQSAQYEVPSRILGDYSCDLNGATAVSIANVSEMDNVPSGRTFALWFKYDGAGASYNTIFSSSSYGSATANTGFAVYLIDNGASGLGFEIWSYGIASNGVYWSSIPISNSNETDWHHVIITIYSSTVTLYVNGVNLGTPTNTSGYSLNNWVSGQSIVLGEQPNNSFDYDRYIDDFKMYNKALTNIECLDLYNADSQ